MLKGRGTKRPQTGTNLYRYLVIAFLSGYFLVHPKGAIYSLVVNIACPKKCTGLDSTIHFVPCLCLDREKIPQRSGVTAFICKQTSHDHDAILTVIIKTS